MKPLTIVGLLGLAGAGAYLALKPSAVPTPPVCGTGQTLVNGACVPATPPACPAGLTPDSE